MNARVYRRTRTGLYVLKLESGNVPKIGDVLVSGSVKLRVLDVIGPVTEPFLVTEPLGGELKEGSDVVLELQRPKKRARRRR